MHGVALDNSCDSILIERHLLDQLHIHVLPTRFESASLNDLVARGVLHYHRHQQSHASYNCHNSFNYRR